MQSNTLTWRPRARPGITDGGEHARACVRREQSCIAWLGDAMSNRRTKQTKKTRLKRTGELEADESREDGGIVGLPFLRNNLAMDGDQGQTGHGGQINCGYDGKGSLLQKQSQTTATTTTPNPQPQA